ncbi:hypothetical protein A3F08_02890 [Candidatus Berkelbacteria bacterium RIFCSPHIGHO2_12_FULL_36_9]|uniref:Uncharacterized protein n=1 Tax=Candidatus Berkelbacteria bacterium RIFCSPHIGHO2_12_FULL_36_9 TaxID=1797469 RepID=A0A1F5EKI0_9BACT|nr:MAG: hypothetical protein A3F08_02890 [Candidatus Berkelbacteria bacterium RIFCSPHIGHO2_12_FULL_36_9]
MIEIHRKGGKELVGKKKTKAEELFELSKNVATGEIPVETKEQQSKREEAEMLRKSVEDEYNSLILVCRNKAGQGKFCVELFCKLYDYSIVIAIYTEEELLKSVMRMRIEIMNLVIAKFRNTKFRVDFDSLENPTKISISWNLENFDGE